MQIIDLTQTIVHGMQVYPGDEPPSLEQINSLEKDTFTNHRFSTGMHAGTHIDGPWHMVGDKRFIADSPLDYFIGKASVIDIRNTSVFRDASLVKEKASGCSIVLFYTGMGEKFGTPQYLADYPLVGEQIAEVCVEMGIKLLGIDTLSPDVAPHETHKILLGNGVLIAENLCNLHLLLDKNDIEVIALPLKIAADSAPARIIARV
ncbi:MAG: cyclase family protein [Bacteroidota bacterium]|nr:cyclase family protein [Bacteroidota bacterium]